MNEPSLLEETDDGSYYVIQVDEITEPRLKPLDEVREDVVALYEEQQRREGAIARAEELLAKLQETASLDTLAESEGLRLRPSSRSNDRTAGAKAASIEWPSRLSSIRKKAGSRMRSFPLRMARW